MANNFFYRTLRDLLVQTDIPGRLFQLSHPELYGARNQVQDFLEILLSGKDPKESLCDYEFELKPGNFFQ